MGHKVKYPPTIYFDTPSLVVIVMFPSSCATGVNTLGYPIATPVFCSFSCHTRVFTGVYTRVSTAENTQKLVLGQYSE